MTINSAHPFYHIIDHTADLGIIVRGRDVNRLFVNAANAMIDLMIKRKRGNAQVFRDILIDAEDFSDLMVRWLGEILYLFVADKLIVDSIKIKSIRQNELKATLAFASFKPAHHRVLREIKAVTYHQISVCKVNDEWEARVIFDI
jgi:SHS2 domain-containing protein